VEKYRFGKFAIVRREYRTPSAFVGALASIGRTAVIAASRANGALGEQGRV